MNVDNKAVRARIFAKLKSALKDGSPVDRRRSDIAERLANPPTHPRPSRIDVDPTELRKMFRGFLEGQSATVVEVASSNDVPAAIANYLRANNLPQAVRVGADGYLESLPWSAEPTLRRDAGAAVSTDQVGLSHAIAGVAETGTLALASGPDNPVTLNFVPETHIVVVENMDLVRTYEDVWTKVRTRFGKGAMPRTINFISGPSRTADIGGTLVTGAHGPRRLCVILVSET
jgi:L-lactate dehydrogenase complex protein LldG